MCVCALAQSLREKYRRAAQDRASRLETYRLTEETKGWEKARVDHIEDRVWMRQHEVLKFQFQFNEVKIHLIVLISSLVAVISPPPALSHL